MMERRKHISRFVDDEYAKSVKQNARFKSIGSPYGTTSKGVVLNRENRRRIAAMGSTRLERRMLREDSAVAELELRWRLRRLVALQTKARK